MRPVEDVTELGGIPLHHRSITGAGITLHVVTAGTGPPVLLLHGFPEHWWSWRHQIPALVHAGYSVWVPDLRGYHGSERPVAIDAYDLRHLVADAAALVRATGASRADIVGHDWGGVIAWGLAGHYPDLVNRLIILNAPHLDVYVRRVWRTSQMWRSAYVPFFALPWLPERTLSARQFHVLRSMMRRLAVRKDALTSDDLDRYVDALSPPGALSAALAYYRANLRPGPISWARRALVHADTLVIWAEEDPALSPVLLEGLEAVAPHLQIHRVPGCGHWVHAEAAADVNRVMLGFLVPRPQHR